MNPKTNRTLLSILLALTLMACSSKQVITTPDQCEYECDIVYTKKWDKCGNNKKALPCKEKAITERINCIQSCRIDSGKTAGMVSSKIAYSITNVIFFPILLPMHLIQRSANKEIKNGKDSG